MTNIDALDSKVSIYALYDAILTLADESPNYVYKGPEGSGYTPIHSLACYYVHRDEWGEPIDGEGCIVGQAFARLGVEVTEDMEGVGASTLVRKFTNANYEQAERVMWVQSRQDIGEPWGKAVSYIREFAEIRA